MTAPAFVCTENTPWQPSFGTKGGVVHVDADEIGEQSGDMVTMYCPHCKTRWRQELPQ